MRRYSNEYLSYFQSFYTDWLLKAFQQIVEKYSKNYTILFDEEVNGIKTATGNLYITRLKMVTTGINSVRFTFSGSRVSPELTVSSYAFNRGNLKETRINLFHGTYDELISAGIETLTMDHVRNRLDSVPQVNTSLRKNIVIRE